MPRKNKVKGTPITLDDTEVIHLPAGGIIVPVEQQKEFEKLLKKLPKEQREMLERGSFVLKQDVVVLNEEELMEMDPKYKRPTKN